MAEYNNKLQTNNTELQTILNTINNLPEAGSGDGGSVETCTVTMSMDDIASGWYQIEYIDKNGTYYMDGNVLDGNTYEIPTSSLVFFGDNGTSKRCSVTCSSDSIHHRFSSGNGSSSHVTASFTGDATVSIYYLDV